MISRKKMTKKFCRNFPNEKIGFKKDFPAIPPSECFHVYITNMLKRPARPILAFLKNSQGQINSALNSKPYDYLDSVYFILQYT